MRIALVILALLVAGPAVAKTPAKSQWSLFQPGSDIVSAARSQIGNGAIYGRRNLWCARFMARSFASMPRTDMRVGAIAVMSRGRRGGHVGVVSGVSASGDPIVISGNNGGRVRETVYPRRRVLAFVVPQ